MSQGFHGSFLSASTWIQMLRTWRMVSCIPSSNKNMSFQDMSVAHSPESRGPTGERSRSLTNHLTFSAEFTKKLPSSSPRFGSLSHHSFFSRHNPHPHRVRHIQGEWAHSLALNGYLFIFLARPRCHAFNHVQNRAHAEALQAEW